MLTFGLPNVRCVYKADAVLGLTSNGETTMKKFTVKVVGLMFAVALTVTAVSLGCPVSMAKGVGMMLAAMAVIAE